MIPDGGNQSSVTTFVLLGFSEYPNLQGPLFLAFLIIYTVTVVGNLGIILVTRINPKLHTPMYFFLSHLSFLDICYSHVFTPKFLEILIVKIGIISFKGCMVQFYFACTFVITEMFMLAVMAYDRFVAVSGTMMLQEGNQSTTITFVLLGFSEYPDLQVPFFLLFLTIYMVSVVGNLGMIMIIRISPKLHTPMYFFLSHLSFLDFCYSSVLTPKLLEVLVVEVGTISFMGCMMQFFFGCTFVITEMFMLAAMAYDRFVAVCNPLLYTVAMPRKLCALLVAGCYVWGIVCSFVQTCFLMALSFCGSNTINHFGCEYSAVIAASCSDTRTNLMLSFVISTFNEASSLLIILASYVFIVVAIIKMPSTGGLRKAFSTCASHLTAITVFHGIILLLYCMPSSKNSLLLVKVATVLYTVVIPMLNPLIYSLRNNDVKEALRKIFNAKLLSHPA
ncbi:PREDICTED: olfactory receptor 5D18-like [Elephantulus edwardii]|uniref:olfactory receptor 5D18-like n=1 Tax=Elephantulus edwardii TaxID=28737 RepID=UPI0003F06401|nr:PREDICTED: olfactory receptor 5D18-like [Elephantulus edwardii]